MAIMIRLANEDDLPLLHSTPAVTGEKRPPLLYERYLLEQERGKRVVLLAFYDNRFAGYVTVIWQPEYPPFAEKNIPEINDLAVHDDFLRRGIATSLVDEAEKRIFERSPVAGIGVGMYAGYGPAQRMYVLRGYVPDGLGLAYKGKTVEPLQKVPVDDDLILYLTKERPE
jgi:GNAT superfamily N-acetyltransferase